MTDIDPGSSENTKQDKYQKNKKIKTHLGQHTQTVENQRQLESGRIRIIVYFLSETMQARRKWGKIFKV